MEVLLGRIRWLIPGIASHILLWCWCGIAQESTIPQAAETPVAPAPVSSSSEPAKGAIQEANPPLWWLRDADGNLQPAIGWTPEELEELAQIKMGLKQRDQAPRFVVQWMSATGTARGDHAELKIELKILVRDGQGVRVPLRLNQAALREAVKYEGSGKQFLEFEEGGDGYVSYIRGGAEEIHRLSMDMLVPLFRVGNETRLKLTTPRSTNWQLKLQVPLADAVARVSEEATLLPPSQAGEQATELTLLGHGGDVELAWHKAGDPAAQVPTVLEAVGEVLATADGRTIDLEARLNVRSYGGQFDRFRVRLPKGAVLAPIPSMDYTVTPVVEAAGSAGAGQVVDVAMSKKTAGPEEIRLAAQISHEAASAAGPIDLAGFEVIGAARQWGYVAVCAEGEWYVRCEPDQHVRQVETLPEWLRGRGLVAGFEYFRQPFSLVARVVQRETRISVEPEYVLLIDAAQVRLQAKLKYTVRGAKAFRLDVELPQWQLDEVGPDNLVNVDGVEVDKKTGILSIPLVQPSVGQIEVTLRAKQPIQQEQQALTLEMPRPLVTSLGPAAVVVLPADNVELTPDAESTVGLVRQQIVPAIELPKWQQAPLFYRVDANKGVFAADFRVRSRRISSDVFSQISIEPRKAMVEQRLVYRIAYEPADCFTLEMPESLATGDRIQIWLGDQRLSLSTVPDAADPGKQDGAEKPVRKRVLLPSARIGTSELILQYTVDLPDLEPAASIVGDIPLVMPCDGELSGNTLSLRTAEGVRAFPRDGAWRPREDSDSPRQPGEWLAVSPPQRTNRISLNIQADQRGPAGSTVVSRAWIQTWLIGGTRQDRAVFQFTSTQENLELAIPTGVKVGDIELMLDGRTVSGHATPSGQILVPLGSPSAAQPRHLEIRYHFLRVRPGWGTLSVELPRLGQDAWVRRMYWQLILPSTEHVMVVPSGFTAEYRWGWNGLAWARRAVLDQTALESWSGAQAGMDPPVGANCYLFSSLGTVGRCELQTATRSLIVLTASGMALVIGLLLIYVPAMRHPLVLLMLAAALLCAVMIYPGPSLLLSQAASLGVLLTFLAALLQRSAGRRRVTAVPLEPGSSALFEKGSTQVQHRRVPVGSRSSTEAAPAPVPMPVSDSPPSGSTSYGG